MPTSRSQTRWVPVHKLSPLAQALLSSDLGGRDEVPQTVADRVNRLAEQWAALGFDEHSVRPWAELPPAAAAFLAERDVDPELLARPFGFEDGTEPMTIADAITGGKLTVEQVYAVVQRLPKPADAPAVAVAPALFSHAKHDEQQPSPATPKRQPPASPFQ
jgi:hypothetical protein